MFNDDQIEKGIEAQGRAMNKPVDRTMAKSAIDLNKSKLDQQGVPEDSSDYKAQLMGNASKDIGLFSDDEDKQTPLSFNQRGSGGGMNFQRESYVSFEEELERVDTKDSGDRDENLEGMTKIEAGVKLAKYLKSLKATRNEIIHSLVNRMTLDIPTATLIADGKESEVGEVNNDWGATDPLTPGYHNSIKDVYSDPTELKGKNEKKK